MVDGALRGSVLICTQRIGYILLFHKLLRIYCRHYIDRVRCCNCTVVKAVI